MAEDRAYAAREVHRKVYRELYGKCSDAELRLKSEIAHQKIMSTQNLREGQLFLAEMEVCNEILNARQEIRDLIQRKSDESKILMLWRVSTKKFKVRRSLLLLR